MRIDKFEVYQVAMPLIYPWRTAYGEDPEIHSVLVKATSGNHTAWSESSPLYAPMYLPESAGSVFYNVSEFFAPFILNHEFESAEQINQKLSIFKGNTFAKAALEICWWTLQSKITKTPLHKLLGGKTKEVQAGADFGIQDSIDMLLGNIQKAVDAGFPRVKLKVSRGWDLDVLRAVRSTFPDLILHIDCNGGYSLEDIALFKEIDKLNLIFIEQPLHFADVLDHSELAKSIDTPICLDESITSIKSAQDAIKVNACKFINIKPGRVGGLYNSIEINKLARENGIPVWVGGMLESAVGSSICVELATLDNFTYPGDLFPSSRFYVRDLSEPSLELTENLTFKPFGIDLPTPNADMLKKCTLKKIVISSNK
ncbi:MAG: o-succinylbenzoate synthase [SAR202 cluster bacterium]|nr:o-succinylbenzoate synthase [SAR202 cluster bacterium]|tara:strand:- start:1148 stop:2257 length:1110 start_codon:yes stop_codon:yes gene_type:complete